jgi:hypothetical protein
MLGLAAAPASQSSRERVGSRVHPGRNLVTKTFRILFGAAALIAFSGASAGDMYPWRNHAAPYPFLFGNDLDTHQQSRLQGDGSLRGFLYVRYTGVVTADGYRVAGHVNCNAMPRDCVVGWTLDGKPAQATFSHHPTHDHPLFTMPRADIAQPGAYSHFHWTGPQMPHHHAQGFVLELTAKNRFCFVHHGADAAMAGATCRANGGVPVVPGIDIATHLNIIPGAAHAN